MVHGSSMVLPGTLTLSIDRLITNCNLSNILHKRLETEPDVLHELRASGWTLLCSGLP